MRFAQALVLSATAATALRALPPLAPTQPRRLALHRVAPPRSALASADGAADELMRPGDASALASVEVAVLVGARPATTGSSGCI